MKIATNVHRDAFGGITISNLALFDWLEDTDATIVGIEFLTTRHILGAIIFRHYLPTFFSHHIVNGIDILTKFPWEKSGRLRKKWGVLIETTKNILRKETPDVVLINGTYFSPWILAQAAHELGIPVVLRYAGVLQREIQHKNYFVRNRLLVREQWLAATANAVIFPSTLCQTVVEQEILGRPLNNGIVIPNPVKTPVNQLTSKRSSRYTIATIGRWTRVKNFGAFIALHEALLHDNWAHRAIMVTSFWDDGFGISETIERKEPMEQEELRVFYRSLDLLVVPSHFETFCNVAAEALINGTSVLVSKNVGFAETLRKAGLSRMVIDSFDNPQKVAKAVKRIAKIKLTKKERDTVAVLLDPHKAHKNIVSVLESVLKSEEISITK